MLAALRRSPSWGAWIEILWLQNHIPPRAVAPPRGERGLKSMPVNCSLSAHTGRSPSWGAWIEIFAPSMRYECLQVAPPRGERGLTCYLRVFQAGSNKSLPLVGSVD